MVTELFPTLLEITIFVLIKIIIPCRCSNKNLRFRRKNKHLTCTIVLLLKEPLTELHVDNSQFFYLIGYEVLY